MERIMRVAGGSILCLLLLASCSGDIVQPADPASGGNGIGDRATHAGATMVVAGSVGVVTPGSGVSRWISAEAGGVITNGRFTVGFPAGSVPKNTYVTIKTVKTDGSMECEILPLGLILRAPATLIVDLRGYRTASLIPNTIFWFDSQMRVWVDVGSSVGSRGSSLETQIGRLGRYKAGRTGR